MNIQPQGEDLRKAVQWVSDERKSNPKKKVQTIIEEACIKFDLAPVDADFLLRNFRDA